MKIFVLTLVIIILIIYIIKIIIDLLRFDLEEDHNSSKIRKEKEN